MQYVFHELSHFLRDLLILMQAVACFTDMLGSPTLHKKPITLERPAVVYYLLESGRRRATSAVVLENP